MIAKSEPEEDSGSLGAAAASLGAGALVRFGTDAAARVACGAAAAWSASATGLAVGAIAAFKRDAGLGDRTLSAGAAGLAGAGSGEIAGDDGLPDAGASACVDGSWLASKPGFAVARFGAKGTTNARAALIGDPPLDEPASLGAAD